MADSIYTFDPVAANNTALDTIPYGPNQLYHNQIDNWFRSLGSKLAQFVDDLGAVNTVGGTADAITVTLASGITAYATGQLFRFVAGADNTGAATMNVNAIGAKAIRKISSGSDAALAAGDILDGKAYLAIYDAAANSAAGAWIIDPGAASVAASSTTDILTGTGTSNYATPNAIAALWEKGSDEASSGTVAFGEGGFFHITGTTTITDIDFDTAKDGRTVDVVFDGALTLTHNGTTLTLPGGRNITTAAGDRARFVQDSTDNVICLFYQPYLSMPPYITPWVAYTPTFTGFGTATNISFFSRRVGDTLEILGKFTAGTTTNTESRISIGFNGTDGNVSSSATVVPSIRIAGNIIASWAGAYTYYPLIESNVAYMTFGYQSGSTSGLTKISDAATWGSSFDATVKASFPISGW